MTMFFLLAVLGACRTAELLTRFFVWLDGADEQDAVPAAARSRHEALDAVPARRTTDAKTRGRAA